MHDRCTNKSYSQYKDYGGRGIKVCKAWTHFIDFSKWAKANGYEDTLVIDRKNNDGNYTPRNCRFITKAESNRNQRKKAGVYFNKARQLWVGRFMINLKRIYVGAYETKKEATTAVQVAIKVYSASSSRSLTTPGLQARRG